MVPLEFRVQSRKAELQRNGGGSRGIASRSAVTVTRGEELSCEKKRAVEYDRDIRAE